MEYSDSFADKDQISLTKGEPSHYFDIDQGVRMRNLTSIRRGIDWATTVVAAEIACTGDKRTSRDED